MLADGEAVRLRADAIGTLVVTRALDRETRQWVFVVYPDASAQVDLDGRCARCTETRAASPIPGRTTAHLPQKALGANGSGLDAERLTEATTPHSTPLTEPSGMDTEPKGAHATQIMEMVGYEAARLRATQPPMDPIHALDAVAAAVLAYPASQQPLAYQVPAIVTLVARGLIALHGLPEPSTISGLADVCPGLWDDADEDVASPVNAATSATTGHSAGIEKAVSHETAGEPHQCH